MSRLAGDTSGSLIPALSPELARDWGLLAGPTERSMRRRVGWVWGLLVFNVMTYAAGPTNLIPLPHQLGKALPELALGAALILILTANKRLLVRPNIYLILMTVMCLLAAIMSFRGYFGHGSTIRWFRFAGVRRCALAHDTVVGTPRLHDPQLSTSSPDGHHRHRPCRNGNLADARRSPLPVADGWAGPCGRFNRRRWRTTPQCSSV